MCIRCVWWLIRLLLCPLLYVSHLYVPHFSTCTGIGPLSVLSLADHNVSDLPFDNETGTQGKLHVPHLKCLVDLPKINYGENVSVGNIYLRLRR